MEDLLNIAKAGIESTDIAQDFTAQVPIVESLLNPTDFDSVIFFITWPFIVLILNIFHTYMMYYWTNIWAQKSSPLILMTFIHYS